MKYQVKISSGDKYSITEDEAKNIALAGPKGLVFVPSITGYINLSFVVSVVPENLIDKSNINEGRLHDGTKVIKVFGQWKDARNPELHLDTDHYPEILTDEVMSEENFNKKLLN